MENFTEKEIAYLMQSVEIEQEHLAKIIATRKSWDYEKVSESNFFNFETKEDFEKWINDMNESTMQQMKDLDIIHEKLEKISLEF